MFAECAPEEKASARLTDCSVVSVGFRPSAFCCTAAARLAPCNVALLKLLPALWVPPAPSTVAAPLGV